VIGEIRIFRERAHTDAPRRAWSQERPGEWSGTDALCRSAGHVRILRGVRMAHTRRAADFFDAHERETRPAPTITPVPAREIAEAAPPSAVRRRPRLVLQIRRAAGRTSRVADVVRTPVKLVANCELEKAGPFRDLPGA